MIPEHEKRGRIFLTGLLLAMTLAACSDRYTADTFNRQAAGADSRPDVVLKTLNIRPGQGIADLGAGGGYFTLCFARETGKTGKVYAIDVNPQFLEFIRADAKKAGLDNIVTVLAKDDQSNIPDGSVDLIFVRNVFHHLPDQAAYFEKLKKALRPGGRVAVIENRGQLFHPGHFTQEGDIIEKMEKAGYQAEQRLDILPKEYFIIFGSKGKQPYHLPVKTK